MSDVAAQPSRTHFLAEWLIFFTCLLALGSYIAFSLHQDHSRIDARERDRLITLSKVVHDNLARQLHVINSALLGIRTDLPFWREQKNGKEIAFRRLTAMSNAMTGVRTILVLDKEGTATASNRAELIGKDFRQRAYFQAALLKPDPDTFYISMPYTTVLGIFSMNVSRAIVAPDGQFAGIITATLDPGEFKTLLDSVRYTPDTWASITHGDGPIFLLLPEQEGVSGKDQSKPGTFLTRHLQSGQALSVLAGTASTSGEQRLVAMRTVRPADLKMDKPL